MKDQEKFLPIGSVVILEGGAKKIMITGFCSISEMDRTQVYDYSGCIYPEGYLSSNQICLFNHDQIEKVFFTGYESEEEKEFKKSLEKIVDDFKNGVITLDGSNLENENNDLDEPQENGNSSIEGLDLEYL